MARIQELLDMSGRVVLITGGAGHLGRTAAETFGELGAALAILDVDSAGCAEVCDAVAGRSSARAIPVTHDLEQLAGIPKAVDLVIRELGRLDVLVNCAAFVGSSDLAGWIGEFAAQADDPFERALTVNTTAPFALARAAAPHLRESPGGAIINVSSIYGLVGPDLHLYDDVEMGNPAGYAASKGALQQLTRWLATVLAPTVRVNALAPGGMRRQQPDAFQQRYVDRTPMRRMGTEDDVRGAFAYLGSDLSRYVTGQTLVVDGGWTAW